MATNAVGINSSSLLTSLGILNANWGAGRSYIDNFVPFVTDCLRTSGKEPVDAAQVRDCVAQRFGIELPVAAVTTVLGRACQEGVARRSHKRYTYIGDPGQRYEIAKVSDTVRRQIDALVHRFVDYAEREHHEVLTAESAEQALLAYVQEWSVPILRSAVRGAPLAPAMSLDDGDQYLVGSFILHLWERDPDGAAYLENLVKGSMLRSALYLPDLGAVERRFEDSTSYFDTPFLLDALGIKGDVAREAAAEVFKLAADLGARLACFTDTVSEIRGVLTWEADQRRPTAARRKARITGSSRLIDPSIGYADLDHLASNLEAELQRLGVDVESRPDWDRVDNDIEHDLKSALAEEIKYRAEPPLDHDVRCLVSVYRLRRRQVRLQLERCRAIFITTNASLVNVSRRVLSTGDQLAAPLAMLGNEFATLLWLKRPMAAPDLPRKQVIADCHAALNPSDALWNMYLEQIDALAERGAIGDDEYVYARTAIETRRGLMSRTRGSVDRMRDDTAERVLEEAREHLLAPVREKERARADAAEQRADAAEAQRSADADAMRRAHAAGVAATIGRIVGYGAICALVPLVVMGVLISTGVWTVASGTPGVRWIAGLAVVLVVALSVFGMVAGGNVASFAGWIRDRVAHSAERPIEALLERSEGAEVQSEAPRDV